MDEDFRRRRRVDAARLFVLERAPEATTKELLVATLDQAEALTGSRIGFFHFVDDDQERLWLQAWSTNTVARMCTAEGGGQHYPIAQAGVWADCVRRGVPIVHNDYASLPARKGMPEGHAQVVRELTVPVKRGGRVCAVLGVGNKPTDYDDRDVEDVGALADLAWDIAARKRAEEELRLNRERLDLAAGFGGVGLWDLDLVTRQAWRTLQHDRLFGYDALQATWGPEEALRHVVPEDRHIFERAFAEAFRTGRFSYELRIDPVGQPRRWLVARGRVIRDGDGNPVRMMGTVADATDRKQAEESLRHSERLYRTVVDHYPHGVVVLFDREMRVVIVGGRQPVVADPATIAGRRPSEFAPPEQGAALESAYAEALAGRTGHVTLRQHGRTVEVSTHPVPDASGGVAMGLAMSVDVTERLELQSRLAVTSRLAALGTLVAGVAHEINNPLAAELADQGVALEIVREIARRLRGPDPVDREAEARGLDAAAEALLEAQEGGERIARVVKNLSAFGRSDPERSRVRLMDVVADAMRWLPATVGKVARLQVEDGGAPDVMASAGQLGQVLVNLVTNAAHAIPPGRRGLIVIRTSLTSAGRARLEVKDDGVGIVPEHLDRVFEPFFTTHRAGAGKGMGLGLSIAHAIVTAHDGSLTVQSTPARGTTFRLELPPAPGGK
ncbi:MAG: ATP-binding protein [Anaeromyxobacteraceae bacterium]